MNDPYFSKQIVLIWHGFKMPDDMSEQADIFRATHPRCREDIKQGYCPCCGYNFIMSIYSEEHNKNWMGAEAECPKCGTNGFAGQFATSHRKMEIMTKGGCIIFVIIIAAIAAIAKHFM